MSNTMVTNVDCGTGAGGFQPGNTCASGDGLSITKAETEENGVKFKTGQSVTFEAQRNPKPSPKHVKGTNDQYQQEIEPAGRYMTHKTGNLPSGWTTEKVTFNKPLVIKFNKSGGTYDKDSWKAQLSESYGKKGKALSKAIANDGYDGIVTVDKYGTSEIVDLRHLHGTTKNVDDEREDTTKNTGSVYEAIKLVANFGKLRFVDINGRQFAIAPIKILMPRVLHGSKGALFYPPEEIARNVHDWNGKPLVVKHPNLKGSNVSAHLPEIFATQEIGRIYNASIANDNSLTVDGYFDVDITRKLDNRVWNALIRGEKIEVSTGLFTDNEPAQLNAVYEGTPYTHIARNYRPDHLAILPDEQGACSCEDGCGVFQTYNKDERLVLANWLVANLKSPTH